MKRLLGNISIPGDKSLSHRYLMLSLLFRGEYSIENLSTSYDVQSTKNALKEFGIDVIDDDGKIRISSDGKLKEPLDVIDVGNSGTTIRLLSGIAAGSEGIFVVLTGDESIRRRPMKRIVSPLRDMGGVLYGRENGAYAPLAIYGSRLKDFVYESNISSAQVKSSLMFAAISSRVSLRYKEPYKSRDHSERVLEYLGVPISMENGWIVLSGFEKNDIELSEDFFVPGDISSASFFVVGALILEGSEIIIDNVLLNPTRSYFLEVLKNSGAYIEILDTKKLYNEDVGKIRVKFSSLKGFRIDKEIVPKVIDEIPVLSVAAMFSEGETIITGARELRFKESDRIKAIVENINAVGGRAEELEDGLVVYGNGGKQIEGGFVKGYGDHRIIMSFMIAGLKSRKGIKIDDVSWIRISYPEFIKTLEEVVV